MDKEHSNSVSYEVLWLTLCYLNLSICPSQSQCLTVSLSYDCCWKLKNSTIHY